MELSSYAKASYSLQSNNQRMFKRMFSVVFPWGKTCALRPLFITGCKPLHARHTTAASHGTSCPTPAHTTPYPAGAAFSKKPAEAQVRQRTRVCTSCCVVFLVGLKTYQPFKMAFCGVTKPWHDDPSPCPSHGYRTVNNEPQCMETVLENRLSGIYPVGFDLLLIPKWSECCTVSSNFL